MIDRTRLLLPLRRRPLLAIAGLSAAAWIACPVVALVICLAACITCAVIEVVYVLVLIVACVAVVGGILAAIAGLFGEAPGALFGGIVAAAIGFGLSRLAPSLNVGEGVFLAMVMPARLVLAWFVAHDWCIWAWIPAALTSTCAVLTWCVILLARHLPDLLRHSKRRFHDCPVCHHRGRPVYTCPKCGSVERDLRASGYGVLFARCSSCQTCLPTVDLLGRSCLKRSCGRCDAAWDHPDLGRLPVWHIVVADCDRNTPPRTTLCVVAAKLVFVHELGAGHLAGTRSASSLAYLNLLDQVIILGDEPSLQRARPLVAGILGVLERGTAADVRRRTNVSAGIVTRSPSPLTLLPHGLTDATANWKAAMQTMFAKVLTWSGEFNSQTLGSVI